MGKDKWFNVSTLLVSLVSLFLSWQANDTSREAFRRASGRTLPIFNVDCPMSHLLIVGETPTEPESLLLRVRNDGTEPIEAIRYEVLLEVLWAADRAKNQPITPTRFVHEFNRILQPGQTDSVNIAPSVAAHVKTLRIPPGKEQFWAPCRVAVSAKIVGSTFFASATEEGKNVYANTCSFGVTWKARADVPDEQINFGVDLNRTK